MPFGLYTKLSRSAMQDGYEADQVTYERRDLQLCGPVGVLGGVFYLRLSFASMH
jgi:hypothetical protein